MTQITEREPGYILSEETWMSVAKMVASLVQAPELKKPGIELLSMNVRFGSPIACDIVFRSPGGFNFLQQTSALINI